jgi:hypothetical protein
VRDANAGDLCSAIGRLVHQLAIAQRQDAVAVSSNFPAMGNQDEILSRLASEAIKEPRDLLAGFLIQIASWLIGQDKNRIVDKCAGDGDPLLLAPRKTVRERFLSIKQSHGIKEGLGAAADFSPKDAAQLKRQNHVLPHGQCGKEIEKLKYEPDVLPAEEGATVVIEPGQALAIDSDIPTVHEIDPADEIQQRAFAASALAQDSDKLSTGKLSVCISQHRTNAPSLVKAFRQSFKTNEATLTVCRHSHILRRHPALRLLKPPW